MALVNKYVSASAAGGGDGTIGAPWTLAEAVADCNAGNGAGVVYNCVGVFSSLSNITFTSGGAVGSPCVWRGYASAIGDGFLGRTDQGWLDTTNFAVWEFSAGQRLQTNGASFIQFECVNISGSYNGSFVYCVTGSGNGFRYCRVANAADHSSARALSSEQNGNLVVSCDFLTTGATNSGAVVYSSVQNAGGAFSLVDCRVYSSATACAAGVQFNSTSTIACSGNVVQTPTIGINIIAAFMCSVSQCTFSGQGNCAVQTPNAASVSQMLVANNVFANCAVAVKNPYAATAQHAVTLVSNGYYNVAGANVGLGDWPEFGRIDLVADPFVNAATGDFRLVRTSLAVNAAPHGGDIGAIQRPAVWPAAADLKSGVSVDGIIGTYDPITGRFSDPGKTYVVTGHDYLFEGVLQAAEHPTAATSEAAGAAAQLAADTAEVEGKKAFISNSTEILGVAGELDMADYTRIDGVAAASAVRRGVPRYDGGPLGEMPYPELDGEWPDAAEIVRDWLCADSLAVMRLAQFDFGDGAPLPAIFTRATGPRECRGPHATIAVSGGRATGNRSASDYEALLTVTVWGERRGSSKDARQAASAIYDALRRASFLVGRYRVHLWADPALDVSDEDEYPGFALNVRVQFNEEAERWP